jgi:branched-chain amino acid aminotransferase group I
VSETVYLNGEFLLSDQAKISAMDRGFWYGEGLFETMRVYEGKIFVLEKHLNRLKKGLDILGFCLGIDRNKIIKIVEILLSKNRLKNAYLRLTISGGKGDCKLLSSSSSSTFLMVVKELPQGLDDLKRGVKVAVAYPEVGFVYNPLGIKSTNYLINLIAKKKAVSEGAFEAVFVNQSGFLTEGATSNIFVVKDNKVYTPLLNLSILPGITREIVMEICSELGVEIKEKEIKKDELYKADEVFITNSIIEIAPVIMVDKKKIGRGEPGKVWEMIYEKYRRQTTDDRKN